MMQHNYSISKSNSIMGRPTKEAALALKSNMLLFAASDLTADGQAASEYVGYSKSRQKCFMDSSKECSQSCYGSWYMRTF